MIFTPAPWYAVNYAAFFSLQTVNEYGEKHDLLNLEYTPLAENNAKLAAAAPRMYKALVAIKNKIGEKGFGEDANKQATLFLYCRDLLQEINQQ